jgi:hypothetical protein
MNRSVRYILNKMYPGVDLTKFRIVEVEPKYNTFKFANPLEPHPDTEIVTLNMYYLCGVRRLWTIYAGIGRSVIAWHSFKSTIEFTGRLHFW